MVTSFDAQNVAIIHREIDAALLEIAKKWGLTNLATGNLRYNSAEMRVSITGKVVPVANAIAGSLLTSGPIGAMSNMQLFGLIGKVFVSNGERFTITDIKSNRPKFPISAKNVFGKQYKFTKDVVERGKTW